MQTLKDIRQEMIDEAMQQAQATAEDGGCSSLWETEWQFSSLKIIETETDELIARIIAASKRENEVMSEIRLDHHGG